MKVIIAGGSGFLGSALTRALVARRHDVVIISRHSAPASAGVRYVKWRPDTTNALGPPGQEWTRELDGADAVVNLAGAGIADTRWSAARKAELRESRVGSTRALVAAVRATSRRPSVFIQGSAMGYYGTAAADVIFDESSRAGSDFLGRLCVEWEAEARPVEQLGCRLAYLRSGIVLGHGGALAKMRRPFLFFVGGAIAPGHQYFSWIHVEDWIALVLWLLDTPGLSGTFNGTAPNPVTNTELSRALGRALHRPSWLPVPGFALRILFGELADAGFINGQRVVPKRALEMGFKFKYAAIDDAMAAAV